MTMMCNKDKTYFKTVISKIKYLAEDVMEITFRITEEDRMCFIPGQFILVKISANPILMRAYSVFRYNTDSNELSITVKKVPGGAGTTIMFDSFKEGMEVDLMSPRGRDLIVDKNEKDLLLVATGVGITPILCILEDLVASNFDGKITFMYGARTEKELFYLDDIKEIVSKNSNIEFIPVLSREDVDGIHKGYVTDVVKNMNLTNKQIYMCCSSTVASSFKETLMELNFDMSKFSCESA